VGKGGKGKVTVVFASILSPSGHGNMSVSNTEAKFSITHWTSVVVPASRESAQALEELCTKYWYPLYAYLRRQGRSPEDAKDLTQGFFAHLLANKALGKVDRTKGKFRSFLLACLNHYVQNQRDRDHAHKRGGGQAPIPIDVLTAEEHYRLEPAEVQDPAKIFERRWASTLIEQVLQQLRQQYAGDQKQSMFDALLPFLNGDAERGDYGEVAAKLNKSEGTVRVTVTRMREEFRELLRAEVGRTVSNPTEIDAEIRHLFQASR
jgi:RNA polymerase sigma-70 factor (ECF subfamily)